MKIAVAFVLTFFAVVAGLVTTVNAAVSTSTPGVGMGYYAPWNGQLTVHRGQTYTEWLATWSTGPTETATVSAVGPYLSVNRDVTLPALQPGMIVGPQYPPYLPEYGYGHYIDFDMGRTFVWFPVVVTVPADAPLGTVRGYVHVQVDTAPVVGSIVLSPGVVMGETLNVVS